MPPDAVRLRLVDDAGVGDRTTVSLLASLVARLTALRTVTGAEAVGSMMAGVAQLGREVARTADGARMRDAIEKTVAAHGEAIWTALSLDQLADTLPTPILDHLRNDIALLSADDLEEILDRPLPAASPGGNAAEALERGDGDQVFRMFCDYLVGMWALSFEVHRAVELLVADSLTPTGTVRPGATTTGDGGLVLR